MSTSNKLTYLNETKNQIKKTIEEENLVTIDDNTTFREYADKIKTTNEEIKKYVPIDSQNGTSLQVTNAAPLNAKSLIVDGNLYQETTIGKNVYNATKNQSIADSVTYSADNKKLYMNGIPTAGRQKNFGIHKLPPGDYSLNLRLVNGSITSTSTQECAIFYIYKANSANTLTSYLGLADNKLESSQPFTLEEETEIMCGCFARVTEIFENAEIEYQIVKGSQSDYEFEPFTFGSSPNRQYPQNIKIIDYISVQNNEDKYYDDLTNENLFLAKIGTTKDSKNLSTGILNKNITRIILDGSETWYADKLQDGCELYSFYTNKYTSEIKGSSTLYANYLKNDESIYSTDSIGCYVNWQSAIRLKLGADINTLTELKNYLASNPLEIYCVKKEIETIQLDPINIKMYDGTNNIKIDTNLETNMQLEYYKDYTLDSEVTE